MNGNKKTMMQYIFAIMKNQIAILFFLFFGSFKTSFTQEVDTTSFKNYSLHAQATIVPQYHFNFNAPYSGQNSLLPSEAAKTSLTATAYLAYRPFMHTYLVFNPEAAGGSGLSKTLGIAGFPNGEVYRVGDPNPKPFLARLFIEQRIPISAVKELVEDDQNQLKEYTNSEYISIVVGKFSLTDFFDNSQISHDPRSQFLNWSFMGSGGWDYPANTRGYTDGIILQAVWHDMALRYAITAMPTEANGPNLTFKLGQSTGMVWEFEKTHLFKKNDTQFTTVHAGFFYNQANMGNYRESINQSGSSKPDITLNRLAGRSKWGFYASWETNNGPVHHFIRASFNDGKNETWAFTEIDQSVATGFRLDGNLWNRKKDYTGIAYVSNGLSENHREYLSKGGYGFIIGDGQLNYGHENIIEWYYNFQLMKYLSISPDYQFVWHPAYNKDRGPVHIIGLRIHAEF